MKLTVIQILNLILSFIYLIKCNDEAETTQHGHRIKRIVGGSVAVDKQFPYMAFIMYYYDHPKLQVRRVKCTGVIIAPHWVLTAANCFQLFIDTAKKFDNETMIFTATKTYAMAGILDGFARTPAENYPGLQDRAVDKIYIHESFTKESPMHDVNIALLQTLRFDLEHGDPPYYVTAVPFTTTFADDDVMLSSSTFTGAMPCQVVGYGYSADGPYTTKRPDVGTTNTKHLGTSAGQHLLKYFPANAGGIKFCQNLRDWTDRFSRELLDEFYVCAKFSDNNGGHTCWGDNGAALVCGGKLTGIMSDRREKNSADYISCANSLGYGIFTMVGHPEVYDWIKRFVGEETPLRSSMSMPKVEFNNWPH